MARNDKLDIEKGGFPVYGSEQLDKVDSMRRDKSQPDFFGIPIIADEAVLFTKASEIGNRPASCYTCQARQSDGTCFYLGPEIKVDKVTGHHDSGEPIEYWPCSSRHKYGPPQTGKPMYADVLETPDAIGLIWINAPKPGQPYGGSNCGGVAGGDDCDHYIVTGAVEKWAAKSGFCRVLQHEVEGGDDCAAWRDDDELPWREAQQLICGDSIDTMKKRRLARGILGRSD